MVKKKLSSLFCYSDISIRIVDKKSYQNMYLITFQISYVENDC